jgi:hypothetical protein
LTQEKDSGRVGPASAAGDEGDNDVGGVAVEVLAAPVIDGGGSAVGVTGGDLNVSQRDAGIEGCGDRQRYRYRSPAFGFEAQLVYDASGLVLDYPGIASRVQ